MREVTYICLARLLSHFESLQKKFQIFLAKLFYTILFPMEWGCLKTSFWSDIFKIVDLRGKKKQKKGQSIKSLVLCLLHKPLEPVRPRGV